MRISKLRQSLLSQPIFTWEYLATSFLLSTVIARGVAALYDAFISQKYIQLIVGEIAWNVGSKQPDYLLLFGFVLLFFAIRFGFQILSSAVQEVNGELAESALRELLAYSLLPTGVWIGNALVNDSPSLELIIFSTSLILLTLIFAATLLTKRLSFSSAAEYLECVGSGILSILFALLSGIGFILLLSRINIDWKFDRATIFVAIIISGLIISALLFIKWTNKKFDFRDFVQQIRSLLGFSQMGLPLLFFILIPTAWINNDQRVDAYSTSIFLYIFVGALICISYIDLFFRIQAAKANHEVKHFFSVLSPFCMIALLLYVRSPLYEAAYVAPDDYHWGEGLLPWWLLQNFGYIPFWDYEPARGFVNYIPGLLSNLFFNGDAVSYLAVASKPLHIFPFLGVGFWVISRAIGLLPTFLALTLMPSANSLYEIDVVVTIGVCIVAQLFLKQRPILLFFVWIVACIALILFAPGQGGLFAIATFPFAVFSVYRAVKYQPKYFLRSLIFGAIAIILLCILTPLAHMLIGALRYGVEQSSLNSVAYGLEWYKSRGSKAFFSYPVWEMVRTVWIVVSVLSGLLIYQSILTQEKNGRLRFLAYAIPLFLLTVLLIPRAAGRIDTDSASRLGVTSVWVVCLVLPIIFLTRFEKQGKSITLIAVAILGGLLGSVMDLLPTMDRLVQHPVQVVNVTGLNRLDGDKAGLPKLNNAVVQTQHLQLLQKLKMVLEMVLNQGETYLDLTSQSAQYFYLGYQPPKSIGAVSNLVHKNQQTRALDSLEKDSPPVVLAGSDPYSEGGKVSLRTHLLYRFAAENYIPVSIDQFIIMVRPDRLDRLNQFNVYRSIGDEFPSNIVIGNERITQLRLLSKVFGVSNLDGVPSSWGQSLDSLKSEIRQVSQIDPKNVPVLTALEPVGNKRYKVIGDQPSLAFDLSSLHLNGRDAGLLSLHLSCPSTGKTPTFKVSWESDLNNPNETAELLFRPRDGNQLIPLDSSPRWLLATGLKTIRLELVTPSPCTEFIVDNVTLFQRTGLPERS